MKTSVLGKWAVIAAAVLALGGCNRSGHEEADKHEKHEDEGLVKLTDEEAARAGIRTQPLAEEPFSETLVATATVEANRERIAHVLPRLPGRIVSVSAKLGDRVVQGKPLAILESMEVGEAQSAYSQASSDTAVAEAALKRIERLHAEQIVPAKEYQRAKGDYDKARAQAQAASDRLRMLGITPSAERSAETRATFPLQSPLAGTVIERKAVMGELAKADEALFTVADLSTVWVEADIPEAQLGKVRVGSVARARVAAFPEQAFQGKINHLGAALNKETRTVKAVIQIDNSKGLLRPQMHASVSIETGGARKVLAVPESAVTLVQGLPTVFVEQAAGFEPRAVELGERFNGRVVVKSGVKPDELVVHEGVYALKARLLKSQIGEGHAH